MISRATDLLHFEFSMGDAERVLPAGEWRQRRGALAATLVALLGLTACPRTPPPELSMDPAELLSEVRTAQAKVERVSGNARVLIESPDFSGGLNEFIAAEKPDRLRLETLDFVGNDAVVLVADGKRFAYYDSREKIFYRGDATPENVSRLLPILLPPEEIVAIVCGSDPILPGKPDSVSVHGSQLLLTIASGATGQRLAVGSAAAVEQSRVRRIETGPKGQPIETAPAYDLDFSLFRRRANARFPTEVKLTAPAARVRVDLTWKGDLEVNGKANPNLFRLEPPKNAKVVDLKPGEAIPAPPKVPFRE